MSLGGRIAASSRSATVLAVVSSALLATPNLRADSTAHSSKEEQIARATITKPDAGVERDGEDEILPRGALLERTRRKIQSVYDLIDAGEPQKAVTRIEQLGAIIPDAERLYLYGRALLDMGDYMKARTKLRSAIRRRPRCGEFYYWLGISYQRTGSHALAASSFNKASLKGLETAALHEAWATSLMATVDVLGDISRKKFDLPAEPWQVHGAIDRDGVLVTCVDPETNEWVIAPRDSALFHAQQATALDTHRGTAWLVAGEAWAKAGFHDIAAMRFARAAGLLEGADLSKCHQLWAESLYAAADYDGFIEHAKQSIKTSPDGPGFDLADAYDRAATGHALIGETNKQVNCLKFAVELDPSVERQLKLADALLATERSDEASVRLQDALTMHPSRAEKREIKRRLVRVAQLTMPGRR